MGSPGYLHAKKPRSDHGKGPYIQRALRGSHRISKSNKSLTMGRPGKNHVFSSENGQKNIVHALTMVRPWSEQHKQSTAVGGHLMVLLQFLPRYLV